MLFNRMINVNCNVWPTRPPKRVAAMSSQSNAPPHCLSLNSMPTAKPATNSSVPTKPHGIAYAKCFIRLLSFNHILLSFFRVHSLCLAKRYAEM